MDLEVCSWGDMLRAHRFQQHFCRISLYAYAHFSSPLWVVVVPFVKFLLPMGPLETPQSRNPTLVAFLGGDWSDIGDTVAPSMEMRRFFRRIFLKIAAPPRPRNLFLVGRHISRG
jgi:hypothetical protein